eukprot:gene15881-24265_t
MSSELPVEGYSAVVHGNVVLLFGGLSRRGNPCGGLWELDGTQLRRVACAGDAVRPRAHHAAAVDGQLMYVSFGSVLGEADPAGCLPVLDLETHTWSAVACSGAPPTPRMHHSMTAYKQCLYLAGGIRPDQTAPPAALHVLDLRQRVWTEISCSPAPQVWGHAAVAARHRIFLFGGHRGPPAARVPAGAWVFSLRDRTWAPFVCPVLKAAYDFAATDPRQLDLREGDLIRVGESVDEVGPPGWVYGSNQFGDEGWCPENYVEELFGKVGHASGAVGDGVVYLYGEREEAGGVEQCMWLFRARDDAWRELPTAGIGQGLGTVLRIVDDRVSAFNTRGAPTLSILAACPDPEWIVKPLVHHALSPATPVRQPAQHRPSSSKKTPGPLSPFFPPLVARAQTQQLQQQPSLSVSPCSSGSADTLFLTERAASTAASPPPNASAPRKHDFRPTVLFSSPQQTPPAGGGAEQRGLERQQQPAANTLAASPQQTPPAGRCAEQTDAEWLAARRLQPAANSPVRRQDAAAAAAGKAPPPFPGGGAGPAAAVHRPGSGDSGPAAASHPRRGVSACEARNKPGLSTPPTAGRPVNQPAGPPHAGRAWNLGSNETPVAIERASAPNDDAAAADRQPLERLPRRRPNQAPRAPTQLTPVAQPAPAPLSALPAGRCTPLPSPRSSQGGDFGEGQQQQQQRPCCDRDAPSVSDPTTFESRSQTSGSDLTVSGVGGRLSQLPVVAAGPRRFEQPQSHAQWAVEARSAAAEARSVDSADSVLRRRQSADLSSAAAEGPDLPSGAACEGSELPGTRCSSRAAASDAERAAGGAEQEGARLPGGCPWGAVSSSSTAAGIPPACAPPALESAPAAVAAPASGSLYPPAACGDPAAAAAVAPRNGRLPKSGDAAWVAGVPCRSEPAPGGGRAAAERTGGGDEVAEWRRGRSGAGSSSASLLPDGGGAGAPSAACKVPENLASGQDVSEWRRRRMAAVTGGAPSLSTALVRSHSTMAGLSACNVSGTAKPRNELSGWGSSRTTDVLPASCVAGQLSGRPSEKGKSGYEVPEWGNRRTTDVLPPSCIADQLSGRLSEKGKSGYELPGGWRKERVFEAAAVPGRRPSSDPSTHSVVSGRAAAKVYDKLQTPHELSEWRKERGGVEAACSGRPSHTQFGELSWAPNGGNGEHMVDTASGRAKKANFVLPERVGGRLNDPTYGVVSGPCKVGPSAETPADKRAKTDDRASTPGPDLSAPAPAADGSGARELRTGLGNPAGSRSGSVARVRTPTKGRCDDSVAGNSAGVRSPLRVAFGVPAAGGTVDKTACAGAVERVRKSALPSDSDSSGKRDGGARTIPNELLRTDSGTEVGAALVELPHVTTSTPIDPAIDEASRGKPGDAMPVSEVSQLLPPDEGGSVAPTDCSSKHGHGGDAGLRAQSAAGEKESAGGSQLLGAPSSLGNKEEVADSSAECSASASYTGTGEVATAKNSQKVMVGDSLPVLESGQTCVPPVGFKSTSNNDIKANDEEANSKSKRTQVPPFSIASESITDLCSKYARGSTKSTVGRTLELSVVSTSMKTADKFNVSGSVDASNDGFEASRENKAADDKPFVKEKQRTPAKASESMKTSGHSCEVSRESKAADEPFEKQRTPAKVSKSVTTGDGSCEKLRDTADKSFETQRTPAKVSESAKIRDGSCEASRESKAADVKPFETQRTPAELPGSVKTAGDEVSQGPKARQDVTDRSAKDKLFTWKTERAFSFSTTSTSSRTGCGPVADAGVAQSTKAGGLPETATVTHGSVSADAQPAAKLPVDEKEQAFDFPTDAASSTFQAHAPSPAGKPTADKVFASGKSVNVSSGIQVQIAPNSSLASLPSEAGESAAGDVCNGSDVSEEVKERPDNTTGAGLDAGHYSEVDELLDRLLNKRPRAGMRTSSKWSDELVTTEVPEKGKVVEAGSSSVDGTLLDTGMERVPELSTFRTTVDRVSGIVSERVETGYSIPERPKTRQNCVIVAQSPTGTSASGKLLVNEKQRTSAFSVPSKISEAADGVLASAGDVDSSARSEGEAAGSRRVSIADSNTDAGSDAKAKDQPDHSNWKTGGAKPDCAADPDAEKRAADKLLVDKLLDELLNRKERRASYASTCSTTDNEASDFPTEVTSSRAKISDPVPRQLSESFSRPGNDLQQRRHTPTLDTISGTCGRSVCAEDSDANNKGRLASSNEELSDSTTKRPGKERFLDELLSREERHASHASTIDPGTSVGKTAVEITGSENGQLASSNAETSDLTARPLSESRSKPDWKEERLSELLVREDRRASFASTMDTVSGMSDCTSSDAGSDVGKALKSRGDKLLLDGLLHKKGETTTSRITESSGKIGAPDCEHVEHMTRGGPKSGADEPCLGGLLFTKGEPSHSEISDLSERSSEPDGRRPEDTPVEPRVDKLSLGSAAGLHQAAAPPNNNSRLDAGAGIPGDTRAHDGKDWQNSSVPICEEAGHVSDRIHGSPLKHTYHQHGVSAVTFIDPANSAGRPTTSRSLDRTKDTTSSCTRLFDYSEGVTTVDHYVHTNRELSVCSSSNGAASRSVYFGGEVQTSTEHAAVCCSSSSAVSSCSARRSGPDFAAMRSERYMQGRHLVEKYTCGIATGGRTSPLAPDTAPTAGRPTPPGRGHSDACAAPCAADPPLFGKVDPSRASAGPADLSPGARPMAAGSPLAVRSPNTPLTPPLKLDGLPAAAAAGSPSANRAYLARFRGLQGDFGPSPPAAAARGGSADG